MIFLSRKWLPFKALNFVLIIITLVIFALFSLKTDDSTKNNQKQHHTSELVMENNILTVYNPSTPKMGTLNLQLEKILEIPASKIEGEQSAFFGPIAKTKSGKILIGDPSEICVYIFSPEGNLVNRFLSRGEGPGQCMTGLTSIQTLNDYIWIPDKHKFMKFQNDGKLIEEYKFSKEYRDPMVIDDSHFMVNHLIYSDGVKDSPSDFNCITSLMDLQENVVQKYLERKNMGITRSVKKIGSGTIRQNYYMKATTPKILYKYDENSKKLYLCETQDYSFQILDLKGNILRVVHRDHENKKLQQSDREEIIEEVLVKQPPEFKRLVLETLPPQFCAILDIQLLPKDFVVVYRITGFSTYEMDLFGPDGIFLRTLRVPLKTIPSGMFFYKENLVMVETVDEVDTYREYRIKNYADIFSH